MTDSAQIPPTDAAESLPAASLAGTELVPRSMRFSAAEWRHVEAAARLVRLSPSRFVRTAALGLPVDPARGALTDAGGYQLLKIMTNLQQLVAVAESARQAELVRRAKALKARCEAWIVRPPGARTLPRPTFDLAAPQPRRRVRTVRFTPEDWADLSALATRHLGVAVSRYVRTMVLSYDVPSYGSCVSAADVERLRGLGRKLNSWVHQANVHQSAIAEREIVAILAAIEGWLEASEASPA